jgi:hypothetical protein
MTLLPSLYKKGEDKYRAEASLTYNGVTGYAEMNLTVNRPPKPGTCTVTPSSGVFISTKFKVSGKGWSDDSKIFAYEVYGKQKNKFIHSYS